MCIRDSSLPIDDKPLKLFSTSLEQAFMMSGLNSSVAILINFMGSAMANDFQYSCVRLCINCCLNLLKYEVGVYGRDTPDNPLVQTLNQ